LSLKCFFFSFEGFVQRNKHERALFEEALSSNQSLSNVKMFLDKGVDVMQIGAVDLLRKANAEIITFFHSMPHVRNLMFSSSDVLDVVSELPVAAVKALASEKVQRMQIFFFFFFFFFAL
jgi:hypothetical protein